MSARNSLIRWFNRLHESIFRATNGRILGYAGGMPVAMVTTIGRKSGRPSTVMLTVPVIEDDNIVVIASFGGNKSHPIWFLNLRDNPNVEVTMLGESGPRTARIATPEERARLWPKAVEKYPGYASYQERTDREIPVVLLEPKAA